MFKSPKNDPLCNSLVHHLPDSLVFFFYTLQHPRQVNYTGSYTKIEFTVIHSIAVISLDVFVTSWSISRSTNWCSDRRGRVVWAVCLRICSSLPSLARSWLPSVVWRRTRGEDFGRRSKF